MTLPQACDVAHQTATPRDMNPGSAYKLHIDAADGMDFRSVVSMTSASVNDCQVGEFHCATMTAARVTNLYDLMDAAYDAAEIRAHSESLGHVPIRCQSAQQCRTQARGAAGG